MKNRPSEIAQGAGGQPGFGLTPRQEIIEIDVPPHGTPALQASLTSALARRPLHRIVALTMATYGEFPLHYRLLVVIEYLQGQQ